jgi:membrane protein DedA with SNARE-associated domain
MDANLGALFDSLLKAADMWSVFLASFVEKFIPVLPSYILFPAIGMGASDWSDLLGRCLVASFGSVAGAAAWYYTGASIGPQRAQNWVIRYGKWLLLKPALYKRMRDFYEHDPFRITFIGQLIPTVRIFQALPAGVLRLPLIPFLAATALGAQVWIFPLATAGFVLRQHGWSATEVGTSLFFVLVAIEGSVFAAWRVRVRWHSRTPRQSVSRIEGLREQA